MPTWAKYTLGVIGVAALTVVVVKVGTVLAIGAGGAAIAGNMLAPVAEKTVIS